MLGWLAVVNFGVGAITEESEKRVRAVGKLMGESRRADLLADAAAGRGPNTEQLVRLFL